MRKFSATGILLSLALAIYSVCLPIDYPTFPHIALAAGEAVTVHITGSTQPPGFFPPLLTIHVYDTVVFVNQGNDNTSYSIVADDNSFSSPTIAPAKQWIVTFNTPGEHEYHTSTHAPHMVGVIIVVPNSISLLPTPVPGIESTVITLVKAGKTPPDTLIVPSPTPLQKQPVLATSLFSSLILPILLIFVTIIALLGLSVAVFYLVRILRQRLHKTVNHDDDEDEEDDDDDDDD